LAFKPGNISHNEAAAATLAALTAWQFIKHYAKVQSGERVLIQAASGGVGHYAVQIAKYLDAYVIATSSGENRDFVLSLGADEHFAYDKAPIESVVCNIDFVFDGVGGDNILRSLKVVKPGGRIIGLLPIFNNATNLLAQEIAKSKGVCIDYYLVKSNGDDMKKIAGLLEWGIIKSHVSKVFQFDEMAEAHLFVERGKTVGKILQHFSFARSTHRFHLLENLV